MRRLRHDASCHETCHTRPQPEPHRIIPLSVPRPTRAHPPSLDITLTRSLGVKGSQVQILSARPKKPQVRGHLRESRKGASLPESTGISSRRALALGGADELSDVTPRPHRRGSGAWLWADVLVRAVAEVVRPLFLGEVAAGDPAGELDGMVRPGVPLEDRASPQRCDQHRVAVAGERRLRDRAAESPRGRAAHRCGRPTTRSCSRSPSVSSREPSSE